MSLMVDQLECRTDAFAQCERIISLHWQSAAFLRTIGRKGSNDGVTSVFHAAVQALDISLAVALLDQEVKGRAIVPDIERLRGFPDRDVGDNPADTGRSLRTEPVLCRLQRGRRYIEHG